MGSRLPIPFSIPICLTQLLNESTFVINKNIISRIGKFFLVYVQFYK